jgi:hypothetical protein
MSSNSKVSMEREMVVAAIGLIAILACASSVCVGDDVCRRLVSRDLRVDGSRELQPVVPPSLSPRPARDRLVPVNSSN